MLAYPEPQVLTLTDGRGTDRLARGDEQGHIGVAEAEGRQLLELAGESEGECRRGHDRVDPGDGCQIVVDELRIGVHGEGLGESLELVGANREPRCGAVAAESFEVVGARGEPGMEVEARHRAS